MIATPRRLLRRRGVERHPVRTIAGGEPPVARCDGQIGIDALCARSGDERLRNVGALHLEDGKRVVNHAEYDVEPLIVHKDAAGRECFRRKLPQQAVAARDRKSDIFVGPGTRQRGREIGHDLVQFLACKDRFAFQFDACQPLSHRVNGNSEGVGVVRGAGLDAFDAHEAERRPVFVAQDFGSVLAGFGTQCAAGT